MNVALSLILSGIFFALGSSPVQSEPKDAPLKQQSSYELMSAENKAMQDDPSLNPAMFWVGDGENLWQQKIGSQNKSCSSCHGDAKKSMRGVATQFPKVIKGLDFNPSMQHTTNCVSARSVAHETTTSNLLHSYPEGLNVGALEKGRFSPADCPVI